MALTVVLIVFVVLTAENLKNRSLPHSIQNTETAIATESPLKPTMQQLTLACKFFSEGDVEMDLEFCQSLTDAGGNVRISGFTSMPSEIGFLTQLTRLHIDSNMLTGTLPSTLGNLVNLKYLSISRNKFTGTIPSTLGNLVQLTHLQMDSNTFTGTVPSSYGNLVQLTNLYVFDNPKLQGTIPSTLCESSPAGRETQVVIDCQNIECSCCRPFGFKKRCCSWCFWWKIKRKINERKSKTFYSL